MTTQEPSGVFAVRRTMLLLACIPIVLAFGITSCGGGDGPRPPTSPQPPPTITGLAITSSTDLLKINQSETFTLTATMSDGGTRPITGTWRSDSPAIANVDSGGRVTGVGSGETAISAESNGARATPRTIRVLPDYQGRWSGDWRVAGCMADGDWSRSDICRELPVGTLMPFGLALTQDRDTATGTVTLDDVAGPVQGSIRLAGELGVGGTFIITDEGLTIDVSVTDWETTTTDNQRMTGRFVVVFRQATLRGSVRFDGELRIVTKSAATTLSAAGRKGQLRRALDGVRRR
jgi:Big-like domain-containing protein